jgi:universal stress protein A
MCYKHILVAVDLTEESKVLVQKAVALAKPINADLSFIHIDVNYAEVYTGLIDINRGHPKPSYGSFQAATERAG